MREEARRARREREEHEREERARRERQRAGSSSGGNSSSGSGGSGSTFGRRSGMTEAEALRIVFAAAGGLVDDGTAAMLKKAWRRAVRNLHPDHNRHHSDGEAFKRLERAGDLLKKLGLFRTR